MFKFDFINSNIFKSASALALFSKFIKACRASLRVLGNIKGLILVPFFSSSEIKSSDSEFNPSVLPAVIKVVGNLFNYII